MSNKVLNLAWSSNLGGACGTRKLVLVRLADFARDDGTSVYPSLATIVSHTGLSERTVRTALRELEAMSVLVVVRRGGGREKTTRYRIDLATLAGLSKGAADAPFIQDDETGNPATAAPFISETRQILHLNPATAAPEPLLNPKNTPSERGASSETPTPAAPLPPGGGAIAPSVNGMIWKEGVTLLSPYVPEARSRSLIGKWAKRASQADNLPQLLTIIRAAQRAGTADPVPYIEAALSDAFPPPPDPAKLTDTEWGYRIRVAIERKEWLSEWGAKPGDAKCLVPAHLITDNLRFAMRFAKQRAA